MKKQLLFLFASTVCIGNYAKAQSIPNGSFENWSSTAYDMPTNWFNSNDQNIQRAGIINVTKVTGVTGFAIKLETKKSGVDTLGAYFTNTSGDPTVGEGGIPYSQKPTTITGKYMANMVGSDSAVLLIVFKKNGVVIGMNTFTLAGKNQTTFSTFNFSLICSAVPDSVVIAGASSNLISNKGVAIGSNIVYDDLAFGGTGITQAIPNGNFDTWVAKSWDVTGNWNSFGQGVSKTSDAYKGSYAIQLQTTNTQGNVNPSIISSGNLFGGGNGGGYPFTNQIDTVFGYYKYTPVAGDTGVVYLSTSKSGTSIGGNVAYLFAKSTYTYFEIPITSFTAPDSLQISIVSSASNNHPAGSILIIDEVQLKSQLLHTGLLSTSKNYISFNSYPNPASNTFNIDLSSNYSDVWITIIDVAGKEVLKQNNKDCSSVSLNISQLPKGIYTYTITNNLNQKTTSRFIKD